MGMVVQHNMNAINAYNRLNANVAGLKKASEKLSSGYRINRAGDDAAGLAISEKMRSQIKGLNQAVRNSQDGINMIQTFEGAAQETHTILQRMKELATESANGTYDDPTDRAAVQLEFDHLNDELNQIADTDFNGTIVLNGGVMADGLKAEKGEFNYDNLEKQQQEAMKAAPVDLAVKDYSGKVADIADGKFEVGDPNDKTAVGAGKLWKQADDDKMTSLKDSSEINIKYSIDEVDNDGKVKKWKGEYVDAAGNKIGDYKGTINTTANGGFEDTITGSTVTTSTLGGKVGDFVTVKYTKPDVVPAGPTGMGYTDTNKEGTGITVSNAGDFTNLEEQIKKGLTMALDANVAGKWVGDTNSKTYQDAIALLDGATITLSGFQNAAATTDAGPTSVKITDSKGADTTLAVSTNTTKGWGVKTALPTAGGTNFVLTYNNVDIATVTYGNIKGNGGTGNTATVAIKVAVDGYKAPSTDKPNAAVVASAGTTIDKSVSTANANEKATSRMTYTENITLQTGARTKDAVNFNFNYNADKSADMGELINNLDLSSRANGLNTANLSLANQKSANEAIDQIDKAINKTSMVRASFGAMQNRLEHKITNLTTTSENLTEAESSIRDTDMASEMMNYTKFNILQQAAQSMLAQANQQPQSVLQLLG